MRCRMLGLSLLFLAPALPAQGPSYSGHGAASVPAAVVAKHAPPPLDRSLARRIEAMLDVRAPGMGILVPDGRTLYFGWTITGTAQVFRLDDPKGFPLQLTGGADPTVIRGVTPDGRWLVLQRDAGGSEDAGLFLQPAGGGPLTTVQDAPRVRTAFLFASDDGRSIYYNANDIAPDSFAVYRHDIASGTRTTVFADKGLWTVADRLGDGDGLRLLLVKVTGAAAREFYDYVPATRALTPLLGIGESVEYSAAYAAQPGELLVVTNRFADFRRLYRWKIGSDVAVTSFREIPTPAGRDVASLDLDKARRRVYIGINDGGYARLVVLDARTYAPLDLALPSDAEQVRAGQSTPDGRYVTIGIETGAAPRTSYVWDWERQALTQWVVPTAPEVDLSRFVPARLSAYPARDGTRIPMFVRFPSGCAPDENPAADPCPVVVLFHGGPEGQARPGFSPYRQLFVDAGFVLVEPNVRGSDGYGKTWLDADNGPKRLEVITDIDDAGRSIRTNWAHNGKAPRIGIAGGSYGGYSTLIGMTMFAGTYDAGAAMVVMSDLAQFLGTPRPTAARCGSASTATRSAMPRRCAGCRRQLPRAGAGPAAAHPGRQRSARAGRRGRPDARGIPEARRELDADPVRRRGPRCRQAVEPGARDRARSPLLR